jgi:hypothetical protein
VESLFALYRPSFDVFADLKHKEQLSLIAALSVFGLAFARRGDPATGVARPLPAPLAALSNELYDRVGALLEANTNGEIIENLITKAAKLNVCDTPRNNKPPRRMVVFQFVGEDRTATDVPAFAAALLHVKQDVLATLFVPEHSDTVGRFVTERVFPRLSSPVPQVRDAATGFLSGLFFPYWRSLFPERAAQNFAGVARADKTEPEFLGALNLIGISVHETVADPALLAAFVRALLTTTYAPQWKADPPLASIIKTLEALRVHLRHAAYLGPAYEELQEAALGLTPGSLNAHARYALLYFLAVGPAPPARALFAYFWANLLDLAQGRKAAAIGDMARLLVALTPREPAGAPLDAAPSDSAAGFWRAPARVRPRTPRAPAPAWLALTAEEGAALVAAVRLTQEPNSSVRRKIIGFWRGDRVCTRDPRA